MPVIDMHAHVTPERYKEAIRTKGEWYGLGVKAGGIRFPGFRKSVPERLAEMDELGVDIQLITPTVGFYQYGNELATTKAIARECNDEVAELTEQYPSRFAGLATLPMQDVGSAIAELERAMFELKMKGVVVSDHVNGRTWDEPEFRPFFRAIEELGAIIFFHQSGDTCVNSRINRYDLGNAIGNLTERTLVFAALVFSGVMDEFPGLKVLLGHGGGYTAYGIGRLDKVAGACEGGYPATGLEPPFAAIAENNGFTLTKPPSAYLNRFYYDCCTYDGLALRFLIDRVGVDRVVLGTDYPAPMLLVDAVNWVNGLDCLTDDEKDAILRRNAGALLDVSLAESR